MAKEKKIDKKEILQELADELFSLMGIASKATVKEDMENDALIVDVEGGEETGLLIGRHGETLASIQVILGMMLRNKLGEWSRVVVNVGDWREREEEKLEELATQAVQRAIESGEEQPLYNLNPAQRRIVHVFLSTNTDVVTESQGEGEERYLVIKSKAK